MLGLMQDRPLLISQLIEHAAAYYPDVEIVSRTNEGPIHRYGYAQAQVRAKKIAEAVQALGIRLGDRVGNVPNTGNPASTNPAIFSSTSGRIVSPCGNARNR